MSIAVVSKSKDIMSHLLHISKGSKLISRFRRLLSAVKHSSFNRRLLPWLAILLVFTLTFKIDTGFEHSENKCFVSFDALSEGKVLQTISLGSNQYDY